MTTLTVLWMIGVSPSSWSVEKKDPFPYWKIHLTFALKIKLNHWLSVKVAHLKLLMIPTFLMIRRSLRQRMLIYTLTWLISGRPSRQIKILSLSNVIALQRKQRLPAKHNITYKHSFFVEENKNLKLFFSELI